MIKKKQTLRKATTGGGAGVGLGSKEAGGELFKQIDFTFDNCSFQVSASAEGGQPQNDFGKNFLSHDKEVE